MPQCSILQVPAGFVARNLRPDGLSYLTAACGPFKQTPIDSNG